MIQPPYLQDSIHVRYYRQLSQCADLPAYHHIFSRTLPSHPHQSLLELACGDGRILESLVPFGFTFTGLDSSQVMLNRLASHWTAHTPVQTTQADMCSFSLQRTFDYILLGFRTFHMLLTPQSQLACLQHVASHLNPNGTFLLHLLVPDPTKIGQPPSPKNLELPGGITVNRHTLSHQADLDRQVAQAVVEYRLTTPHQPDQVEHESLNWSWIWPNQLRNMLAQAGLHAVQAIPAGPDVIWLIQKNK